MLFKLVRTSVEEGEGHGPRRELFALASSQFAGTHSSPHEGKCLLNGKRLQSTLTGSGFQTDLKTGAKLTIRPNK